LPADTLIGPENDRYRIDSVLGPGGFGITYLARSLRLDRDVAVKEYFPAEFAYRDGATTVRSAASSGSGDFFFQGKRYFVEEARTLGKFRHEHIVRVIGLLEENNTAYMVLEFEEGQSFKHWLKELGRPPSQAEIDAILEPMLSALEAIHDKGIFHRDIAPDNIIVRPNGKPVLIDFGAARHFARESSHTLGAIVKHGYSPPEQYTLDTKLQGAWSDIYALCATMYHAIMGHPPEEASKRQLQDSVLPIAEHMDAFNRSLYHPSFIAGLEAGLTLSPRKRPASIAALREVLYAGRDLPPDPNRPRTEPGRRPAQEEPRRQTGPASSPASDPVAPAGHTRGTVVRPAPALFDRPASQTGGSSVPAAATGDTSQYSEIAGFGAIGLAAIAALAFLQLGGSYHPNAILIAAIVCLGLCAAGAERGLALFRESPGGDERTAVSTAVVIALMLSVFWLPLSQFQLSVILAALAAAFAWFRFSAWMPATVIAVALMHLAIALWMLMGTFEFTPRADGARPNPMFWPLMASCLGLLSLVAMACAIKMRRRPPVQAS
jgi:serine/threonine protein kinase